MILLICQVDDICTACLNEELAKDITNQIGEKVKFQHEESLPITFLGLVRDYTGVDIQQYSTAISISAEGYIERLLKTHGWDKPSSKESDSEHSTKPIAPLPTDCLQSIYQEQGPREGTIQHTVLEKKHKFF